jgi:hypothetical protein
MNKLLIELQNIVKSISEETKSLEEDAIKTNETIRELENKIIYLEGSEKKLRVEYEIVTAKVNPNNKFTLA